MTTDARCPCGEPIDHPDDHPDECCDCFDAGCGMSIDALNRERAARGAPPLVRRHESKREVDS